MVKFIHCYQLKKEQCVSINRKILSVTFSEKFIFLSASDFSILIYNISTFEEVTYINTLGLTKFLTCNNEGNLLATIELNEKQSVKENATVRVYLNLNSAIQIVRYLKNNIRTKAIVAGSYSRRKHFTRTFCELLPGKETILSVELPLKDNPLAVEVNSHSNVVVGLDHRILVYSVERHTTKSQTLDADMMLMLDIELNFKVKQISTFNEYLAASSKLECQVFKCVPKEAKENDLCFNALNEIRFPVDAVSKRSRTLTRQEGFTFQEFNNKNEVEVQNGVKVKESVGGGVKVYGINPENSSICPKLEFLYEIKYYKTPTFSQVIQRKLLNGSRSCSKPITVVYNKCDSSSTLLPALFYQIKDKSGSASCKVDTYVLISTETGANLYNISEKESVFKFSFQFASLAYQVSVDGAHVLALGKDSLEVFTNPNISFEHQAKSEEVEPMLICIHELPQTYNRVIRPFDQQIMILQLENILEVSFFTKPSPQEETNLLLEASKHVNEDVGKHLRLQIQTLHNYEFL